MALRIFTRKPENREDTYRRKFTPELRDILTRLDRAVGLGMNSSNFFAFDSSNLIKKHALKVISQSKDKRFISRIQSLLSEMPLTLKSGNDKFMIEDYFLMLSTLKNLVKNRLSTIDIELKDELIRKKDLEANAEKIRKQEELSRRGLFPTHFKLKSELESLIANYRSRLPRSGCPDGWISMFRKSEDLIRVLNRCEQSASDVQSQFETFKVSIEASYRETCMYFYHRPDPRISRKKTEIRMVRDKSYSLLTSSDLQRLPSMTDDVESLQSSISVRAIYPSTACNSVRRVEDSLEEVEKGVGLKQTRQSERAPQFIPASTIMDNSNSAPTFWDYQKTPALQALKHTDWRLARDLTHAASTAYGYEQQYGDMATRCTNPTMHKKYEKWEKEARSQRWEAETAAKEASGTNDECVIS